MGYTRFYHPGYLRRARVLGAADIVERFIVKQS